ncbi:uncharacterized protein LOC127792605 [Diospyros lotus]|uniref:uncharacterized protein LOC127792605 n=1 Tax=Diospyros lotus TaxID=55363 RepID=UPI002253973F|nr:uncharacterized protein LOC127792605 [Diospyros lotus]
MAGKRELGFPKTTACSLREQLARTTFRNVRLQGHTYVDLREDGKKFIFFCTLCLAPCYNDTVLFDHLKGNLHNGRLAAAKATLLKPNPWPFNDGVLFFQSSSEQDKQLVGSSVEQIRFLDHQIGNEDELAIVSHVENLNADCDKNVSHGRSGCDGEFQSTGNGADCDDSSHDKHGSDADFSDNSHVRNMNGNRHSYDLVVPGVLREDTISDLEVRFLGTGKIAARVFLRDGVPNGICRIWCEWLGNNQNEDSHMIPEHDFAVVTFVYSYSLGRQGLFDDVKHLLSSSPQAEIEDLEDAKKRKRVSFSDPEDISESLSNCYDSSSEDHQSSASSSSRMLVDGDADQLLHSRFISSKTIRRELRRQQRVAAERMCDICQQKVLPGKDVATLLNRKTGRLACSSRNGNGVFHVFHISCLIHWILLRELEMSNTQSAGLKVKRKSRRKARPKCNGSREDDEEKTLQKQVLSVLCPVCQGTGINVDGDELEKPTVPLSEMFRYKIKVSDAHRAWMKSPEVLQNCSTGFHFPTKLDELVQGDVSPLKLLHFYRADT